MAPMGAVNHGGSVNGPRMPQATGVRAGQEALRSRCGSQHGAPGAAHLPRHPAHPSADRERLRRGVVDAASVAVSRGSRARAGRGVGDDAGHRARGAAARGRQQAYGRRCVGARSCGIRRARAGRRTARRRLSTGAIVGIVAGAVAVVVLIGFAIWGGVRLVTDAAGTVNEAIEAESSDAPADVERFESSETFFTFPAALEIYADGRYNPQCPPGFASGCWQMALFTESDCRHARGRTRVLERHRRGAARADRDRSARRRDGRRGDPARVRQRRLRVRLGEPGHLPRLDRLTPHGPSANGVWRHPSQRCIVEGGAPIASESRPEMSMMSAWMPVTIAACVAASMLTGCVACRRRRPRCPEATTPSPSTPRRSRSRSTTRTGRWSRARGGRTSRPTPMAASRPSTSR